MHDEQNCHIPIHRLIGGQAFVHVAHPPILEGCFGSAADAGFCPSHLAVPQFTGLPERAIPRDAGLVELIELDCHI